MHKTFGLTLLFAMAVSASASEPMQVKTWSDLPEAAQESIRQSLREDSWQQLAEIIGKGGTDADGFADSVAIDGDTLVVGAPYTTIGDNQLQGAVYVFLKPKSGWGHVKEVAKLTASDGKTDNEFGGSVAISGDTVLVGGFNEGLGLPAYVFVKSAHGWKSGHETAQLGFCGFTVAISGSTAVCGAGDAATVYAKPKTGWKSTNNYDALLATTDGSKNTFSSIATDGGVVVIGAADPNNQSDVAYLYVRPKGGWHIQSNPRHILLQKAKLTPSDSTSDDRFGLSVSVSGDTVAAGAPGVSAAYVFVKPASGWTNMTQTAKLTTDTTDQDSGLGWSVAVQGNTLVAGNPTGSIANNLSGEAYVFLKPAGGWVTTNMFDARLTPSDDQRFDEFGYSVAMSGQTILVGDNRFQVMEPGAAFVFGH